MNLTNESIEFTSRNIRLHSEYAKPQIIEGIDSNFIVRQCFDWCREQHYIYYSNFETQLMMLIAFGLLCITSSVFIAASFSNILKSSKITEQQLKNAQEALMLLGLMLCTLTLIYVLWFK